MSHGASISEDEDEDEEDSLLPEIKKPARVAGFDCRRVNDARR